MNFQSGYEKTTPTIDDRCRRDPTPADCTINGRLTASSRSTTNETTTWHASLLYYALTVPKTSWSRESSSCESADFEGVSRGRSVKVDGRPTYCRRPLSVPLLCPRHSKSLHTVFTILSHTTMARARHRTVVDALVALMATGGRGSRVVLHRSRSCRRRQPITP